MPYVEVSTIVNGPIDQVYEIAKDMESYPKFMKDVVSVKVVERDGNTTVTEWVTNVDGRTIKWKEKDILDDVNKHITYQQISGDLKKFEGEWRFESTPDGTVITLTVDFELGIPMLAGLLNPLLKKKVKENSEAMLAAIKEQVEK